MAITTLKKAQALSTGQVLNPKFTVKQTTMSDSVPIVQSNGTVTVVGDDASTTASANQQVLTSTEQVPGDVSANDSVTTAEDAVAQAKPWYQQWYVWVIAAAVVIGVGVLYFKMKKR